MADWLLRPDTEAGRWELADRLARGEDPDDAKRMNRRRIAIVLATAVVAALVAVVAGIHGARGRSTQHHRSGGWRAALSVSLLLAGLILMVGSVWQSYSALGTAFGRSSPLTALKRRERRAIMRQIAGRTSPDAHRLTVSRNVAERTVRLVRRISTSAGILLILAGNALATPSRGQTGYALALAVIYATLAGYVLRNGRRAREFLHRNPLGVVSHG